MSNNKLICPECGSNDIVKQGVIWSGRSKVQQWRCKSCGRNTIHPRETKGSELATKAV